MSRQNTVRALILVVLCGLLFSFFTNPGRSQTPRKIKAPQTMLRDLDEEDRQCVVNEGGLQKHVQVRPIDVTPSNNGEVLVRGSSSCLCGAQNCGFWIYRKVSGQYELLLKGIGSTKVRLGRNYAHGYRDVVAESHASAIQTIIRTYQFDGRLYRQVRCVSRDYFDENGAQIKKPRYRPCD
jgi:hypothetical protein